MARFLKFKPRDPAQLRRDGYFRQRYVAECVECNAEFSARNESCLAADLDMAGWKYFKHKDWDIEGPMCPACQDNYS